MIVISRGKNGLTLAAPKSLAKAETNKHIDEVASVYCCYERASALNELSRIVDRLRKTRGRDSESGCVITSRWNGSSSEKEI